ncbi:cupin domain-containing protein [Conexibacter woesei]|nr:cupin domain-containing protein [Conexibacter woesei]
MDPLNVDDVRTVALTSSTGEAAWTGGFFAYGGDGAERSTVIYFAVPPGKRLGRHTDTAEETQFFLGGSGELLRDEGSTPVRAGDVVVLPEGTAHDLLNTGSEDLRVVGFFAAPKVQQHWSTERWAPDDSAVTGSPNA